MKRLFLVFSHLACLAAGFALGVYFLPILTAPTAPTASEAGRSRAQISSARSQRGWNGHPAGRDSSDGTCPGIARSLVLSRSSVGRASSSDRV